MSIFEQAYADSIRDFLNKPPFKNTGSATMYGYDEEREYRRMLQSNRDDLMDQLKHSALATVIIHDHDLCDGDLLQALMTATAMWNEKPETAFERMKVVHRLVELALDRIAEDMTEKEFNEMTARL